MELAETGEVGADTHPQLEPRAVAGQALQLGEDQLLKLLQGPPGDVRLHDVDQAAAALLQQEEAPAHGGKVFIDVPNKGAPRKGAHGRGLHNTQKALTGVLNGQKAGILNELLRCVAEDAAQDCLQKGGRLLIEQWNLQEVLHEQEGDLGQRGFNEGPVDGGRGRAGRADHAEVRHGFLGIADWEEVIALAAALGRGGPVLIPALAPEELGRLGALGLQGGMGKGVVAGEEEDRALEEIAEYSGCLCGVGVGM